jgi:ankyrin repeat protein
LFPIVQSKAKIKSFSLKQERNTMLLQSKDELAHAVTRAIHQGDIPSLQKLLAANPDLATARIIDAKGTQRSLPHIATDWPGHFPNVAKTIEALASAGSDLSAGCITTAVNHAETPLHWAASCDDAEAAGALLDHGANIEATGAIFTNGTAMSDAVVFAQWNVARLLIDRGAQTTIWQASALGLLDRVEKYFVADPPPSNEITGAFWNACRGGHRNTAEYLLDRGADINWLPPWAPVSPLDAAQQSGNDEMVEWLKSKGAKTAK